MKAPCFGTCTTVDLPVSVRLDNVQTSVSVTGYAESSQVAQIFAIHIPSSECVDDVVNDGSSVTFPRDWDVANAGQFCPFAGGDVHRPSVVVVVAAIGSSEAAWSTSSRKSILSSLHEEPALMGSHDVTGSLGWALVPELHLLPDVLVSSSGY